ncbi:hypothetical protein [Peribacillus butanolivorans]|uniref:hypothetical protein n=1 Tax=Peribacillus butanolivorans TaxID=421767 RepID=UPI00380DD644
MINIGILVASFNTLILIIIYMARVFYTSGRERIWPDYINGLFTKVSGSAKVPWFATITYKAVFSSMFVFANSLVASVSLLIATASIISRKKNPIL